MLHRLGAVSEVVRAGYEDFDFRRVYQTLFNFMTIELSAFYFDIRKDALYCDPDNSPARRGCYTVMDITFDCLTSWLAPILCFTTEEVWQSRHGETRGSIHEQQFPDIPAHYKNDELGAKWDIIRKIRRVVTGALEIERQEKRIGSSLEAAPVVFIANTDWFDKTQDLNMADICITSQIDIRNEVPPAEAFTLDDVKEVGVIPALAIGQKCRRSWKILPDVGSVEAYPDLSPRDAQAVSAYDSQI